MTDHLNYLSVTLPQHGTYRCTVEDAAKLDGRSKRELARYMLDCHYNGRDPGPHNTLKYWLSFPKSVLLIMAGDCGLARC